MRERFSIFVSNTLSLLTNELRLDADAKGLCSIMPWVSMCLTRICSQDKKKRGSCYSIPKVIERYAEKHPYIDLHNHYSCSTVRKMIVNHLYQHVHIPKMSKRKYTFCSQSLTYSGSTEAY